MDRESLGRAWFRLPGERRAGPDDLYAGGHFTRVGSVAARHIARWDGAAWHVVGEGLDYP